MKKQIVRFLGHEIRTPLNTALMGLHYLESHLNRENSPIENEYIDVLRDTKRSCDDAVEILNQLLLYDKIDSGLLQLEKTRISPYEFLEDVINPFRNMVMLYDITYIPISFKFFHLNIYAMVYIFRQDVNSSISKSIIIMKVCHFFNMLS